MRKKTHKSKTYKFIEYLCAGAVFISAAATIGNASLGNVDATLGWMASTLFALVCTYLSHKLKFLSDYLKT